MSETGIWFTHQCEIRFADLRGRCSALYFARFKTIDMVTHAHLINKLNEMGYSDIRLIPGFGLCGIQQMICTFGLMVCLMEHGHEGRFCFEHYEDARDSLKAWTGKSFPTGPWIKFKGYGGEILGPGAAMDSIQYVLNPDPPQSA